MESICGGWNLIGCESKFNFRICSGFDEERRMPLVAVLIAIVVVGAGLTIRFRQLKRRRELAHYSIEPEMLHRLLESGADVLVLDVRLPLDLLAYSEIIPGAMRLAPKEIRANPELIPRIRMRWCTARVLAKRRAWRSCARRWRWGFDRVKVLCGGLAGWKAKGLPVSPFTESFHLDTAELKMPAKVT